MSYTYKQDHIPNNTPHNRRPATEFIPTSITIHNTGNPTSTAQNERNWLTNPDNDVTASFNIVIDEKEAIECLPLDEHGWHSGDGSGSKSGNMTSLSIEICESGNYDQTISNAIDLIAKMLKERGWGVDRLKRHWDWARPSDGYRKICPRLMYDNGTWKTWKEFVKKIDNILDGNTEGDKVINKLPEIVKERIYSENGVLKKYPINTNGGKATDVRHIKFETGKYEFKFVYEKGKKVSQLVKDHKALFGFNAPYFNLQTAEIYGNAKSGDELISQAYGKMQKRHELIFKDGVPQIGQFGIDEKVDLMVQGAPKLVSNGNLAYDYYRVYDEVQDDIGKRTCQRTFAWIDKNGDFHLGIADGGTTSTWDIGLTLEEMALYAKEKGAVNALNFDGGGSSILVDKDGKGVNQSQNTGSNERVTNHAILVFEKELNEMSSAGQSTVAAYTSKIDFIDGKTGVKTELEGLIYNDKSYIELREVAKLFSSKVDWNNDSRKATITK
ncbi:phosphodiester glycosidase family protein [Paenibacillus sp. HB172176]|uniref:phosphodiester glycosidase family protein n=1 Tax=Paenibacillus sp. HB172176 TaxID=2493690 RepID=UPI00143AB4C5|nr:phosphodiester glycosidase family protein [Paenibacillus sp. HB172176]